MDENKENLEEVKAGEDTPEASDINEATSPKDEKAEKKKAKKLENEIAELEKKLLAKDDEIKASTEQFVRLYAEYDNFRKRTAKEKDSIYADAYSDALTSILPVLDNLERAAGYHDAENVSKGIEMTLRSFRETLEKLGVEEIDPLGEKFDPNIHNAVMHIEDESKGENEIVEVLMKGYKRGDKVIRYAMVKVAN